MARFTSHVIILSRSKDDIQNRTKPSQLTVFLFCLNKNNNNNIPNSAHLHYVIRNRTIPILSKNSSYFRTHPNIIPIFQCFFSLSKRKRKANSGISIDTRHIHPMIYRSKWSAFIIWITCKGRGSIVECTHCK